MSDHLDRGPVYYGTSLDQADLVVYGVHGRMQSPEFMVEQANRLALDGIAWVLPAAAENSWYPGKFMADPSTNEPQLGGALNVVETQLAAVEQSEDISQETPIVVFGFSQGACLLAEYLLVHQPRIAGAVLHTGGYLGPARRAFTPSEPDGLGSMDVAMFIADQDPWVPLQRAEETREALESVNAKATLHVYEDTEHHINEDSLSRIRQYLRSVISA